MKKDYAKIRDTRESTLTKPFTPRTYEVTNCDRLNLREAPNASAEVAKVLSKGDRLIELPQPVGVDCGNFVLVKVPGEKIIFGYCMKDYLKVIE